MSTKHTLQKKKGKKMQFITIKKSSELTTFDKTSTMNTQKLKATKQNKRKQKNKEELFIE